MKALSAFISLLLFCMQDGRTAAYVASINGHTETLALLLSYNADANLASEVHQLKIILILTNYFTRYIFRLYRLVLPQPWKLHTMDTLKLLRS